MPDAADCGPVTRVDHSTYGHDVPAWDARQSRLLACRMAHPGGLGPGHPARLDAEPSTWTVRRSTHTHCRRNELWAKSTFLCHDRDMEKKKAEGQRFSLTFDEWTSTRNRRYMNINVHARGGEYWSLGLLRVSTWVDARR